VQARTLVAFLLTALAAAAPGLATTRSSHVYSISGGISLGLPSSWKPVDAQHLLDSAALQKLEQENPELGRLIAAATNPSSPVKFFAFDPVVRQRFATNVNVVVEPIPTTVTFDLYAAALAAEIRSLHAVSQLRTRRVTLPGGPALRLNYRIRIAAGGRSFHTSTLQYAFLRGGTQSVVVTYTTLPQLQSRYAATFSTSANSIRFG